MIKLTDEEYVSLLADRARLANKVDELEKKELDVKLKVIHALDLFRSPSMDGLAYKTAIKVLKRIKND